MDACVVGRIHGYLKRFLRSVNTENSLSTGESTVDNLTLCVQPQPENLDDISTQEPEKNNLYGIITKIGP